MGSFCDMIDVVVYTVRKALKGRMCGRMKFLKKLLFVFAFLFMAGCAGILVCAFKPSLTAKLAEKIEGSSGSHGETLSGEQQPGYSPGGQDFVSSGTESSPRPDVVQPGVNIGWMNGRGESAYEQPQQIPVSAPEGFGHLMGLEPVKGDEEQILDEEADNLTAILDLGDTGSDLTFDAEYYPYYAMLQPPMQQLYKQIYANAKAFNVSFMPVVSASLGQVRNVFEAVVSDHPELFWLKAGFSCKHMLSGSCVEITLDYNETLNNFSASQRQFEQAAEAILKGARTLGSDLEKERYVHDALMQITDYDLHAKMNQSAYSALVNGETVCAGYARAFQYLMQQLGIPCYYCSGTAGEDHAWNIVKLGKTYYNVDVTWDDTRPATYDYFNRSDAAFASTHARTGLSVYLPACVENAESAAGSGLSAEIEALINQNPIKPLRWPDASVSGGNSLDMTAEQWKQENLLTAGITADQVRENMNDYYADCKKLLIAAGTGDKTFDNVIPESLWSAVERAYSSGDYWNGYVNDALKELKAENFVIHLQVQRLGGGYYRVYHNVYTY